MYNGFDNEYSTQRLDEMFYLKNLGFRYTYAKKIGDNRVLTFKYEKTPELFRAVADYYEQRKLKKEFLSISTIIDAAHVEAV